MLIESDKTKWLVPEVANSFNSVYLYSPHFVLSVGMDTRMHDDGTYPLWIIIIYYQDLCI